MQIQAKVNVINEVRSGVSQSNGHEWRSQDIVINWSETLPNGFTHEQYLQVTLHSESIDHLAALNPVAGQTVISGDLSFNTRSYNGRVYNEISMIL